MVDRSIAYLTMSEDRMRRFYYRYRAVMNAYKHGRALFALTPEITAAGITLSATFEAATAITGSGRRPQRVRDDARGRRTARRCR